MTIKKLLRREAIGSRRVAVDCSILPSMTVQSEKDNCDINNIMAKYVKTGVIEFANDVSKGRFVDLTSVQDYHSSMNRVIAAQEAFDDLPSKVRSYFENDPANLLKFIADPKNSEKAVELGLATARPSPYASSAEGGSPAPQGASEATPTDPAPSPGS